MIDNLNLQFRIGLHVPAEGSKFTSVYQDLQVNATAREVGGKIVAAFAAMLAEKQVYPRIAFSIADLPQVLVLEGIAKHTVGNDPRLFVGLVEDPATVPGMTEVENAFLRFVRWAEMQFLLAHRDKPEMTDLNQAGFMDRIEIIVGQFLLSSNGATATPATAEGPRADAAFFQRFNQLLATNQINSENAEAVLRGLLVDTVTEIVSKPGLVQETRMKADLELITANYQAALDLTKQFK